MIAATPKASTSKGQKPEEEPDGAAEHLLAGLGDAEGAEEGGRNGFKESHVLDGTRWSG